MQNDVYEKLKKLGLTLPSPPPRGGIYRPIKLFGEKFAYTSGFGPIRDGKAVYTGQIGEGGQSIEYGQEAAKLCILNTLSSFDQDIGSLNKIKGIVKLLGFVSSKSDFYSQPQVINGASQLLGELFGEDGEHARSAIGTNVLPQNISVEIEMIIELK